VESVDPNNIEGPSGYGPQGFVEPELFSYGIEFQNKPTATAPAQVVVVTQQISSNLDWSTFQLGNIAFGNTVIDVPAGQTSYSTQVDLTASLGIYVDVTAMFNTVTGLATWTFTSIDPTTLDVPSDPLVGFLPPDKVAGQGEGFVNYSILPKALTRTGTQINAQATVVFDANAPLSTADFLNTLDVGPPTSSVAALPAHSPPTFTVRWSGTDDPGGSGVAFYDVYVSDDGGAFTAFMTNTTATSASFTGQFGHTYAFYSVATDNVGNVQPTPTVAQAATQVVAAPTSSVSPLPAVTKTGSFTVSWSGTPGPGATTIASYEIFVSDNGGPFEPFVTSTTKTSATFSGKNGHTYAFYSLATDNLGHRQPTPSAAQATTKVVVTAPPPLVTVSKVSDVLNKKQQVTQVLITLSGAVNSGEADKIGTYRLVTPGTNGSYSAKNAGTIKIASATYNAARHAVTLTPSKPFPLTKPVQLTVYGTGPRALQDAYGRDIDGDHNGKAGGNAILILSRGGAVLDGVVVRRQLPIARRAALRRLEPLAVDALLERIEISALRRRRMRYINEMH
jgi:hypothetical protein